MKKPMKSKDVMDLLGISRNTLYVWKREGIISPTTIRGLDFYEEDDIKELLKNGTPAVLADQEMNEATRGYTF